MALTICTQCKNVIHNSSQFCPHCGKKTPSAASAKKIIPGIILGVILLAILFNLPKSPSSNNSSQVQNQSQSETKRTVNVGEVLHTDYFDVKVNKVVLQNRINTGNEFADPKPEEGSRYLVINVTFKNISNESRMITDGSIWIDFNSKKYEFDKSETIMADGWGLFLDQINPLTSKKTNIVYKIPTEIKGPAYWQPGRAASDELIFLGNL